CPAGTPKRGHPETPWCRAKRELLSSCHREVLQHFVLCWSQIIFDKEVGVGPMDFHLRDWVSKAQLKIWLVLGLILAIGAAGSLGYEELPWPWASHAAEALCPPLFTAGVLGLTVDIFLKREIARDVFVAAFRYVLPDELKEEVRRIINYKFL